MFSMFYTTDVKDWYDKYYYVAVMLPNVAFNLLGFAVNALLVFSVVKSSRCMMLPWLIINMIWIVLIGIGLLAMLVGLGFVKFQETETEDSLAYGLGLVGKFDICINNLITCVFIY